MGRGGVVNAVGWGEGVHVGGDGVGCKLEWDVVGVGWGCGLGTWGRGDVGSFGDER